MAKFLTGVVAGIAIGLMIAPDKGSRTRQRITDSINDLLGEARDTVESARQQFNGSSDGFDSDLERPVAKISTDF